MNDYRFLLTPYISSVKSLCLSQSYDFCISDESDTEIGMSDIHILSSVHLNSINDIDLLQEKLKGLIMLINGALSIIHGFELFKTKFGEVSISGSEGISYSDIQSFKEMDVTQINPFDFNNPQLKHPEADKLSSIINLSSNDSDVMTVVGMCSLGADWVNLNRILETVRELTRDFNKKNPSILNYKSKKADDIIAHAFSLDANEINRFTGTVNSFELLGFLSRHGKSSTKNRSSNPMCRIDATILIHSLVNGYINLKMLLSKNNIPFKK